MPSENGNRYGCFWHFKFVKGVSKGYVSPENKEGFGWPPSFFMPVREYNCLLPKRAVVNTNSSDSNQVL